MLIGYLSILKPQKRLAVISIIIIIIFQVVCTSNCFEEATADNSNMQSSQASLHRYRSNSLVLAPRQDMFLKPSFVVRLAPLHQDVEFVGDLKGAVDGFGGSHV